MNAVIGALIFAWIVTSLGSAFSRDSSRGGRIGDAASIYRRLKLGMTHHDVIQMVGKQGDDSVSRDESGEWQTIRWRDSKKILRVTLHNDRLVDWALY